MFGHQKLSHGTSSHLASKVSKENKNILNIIDNFLHLHSMEAFYKSILS